MTVNAVLYNVHDQRLWAVINAEEMRPPDGEKLQRLLMTAAFLREIQDSPNLFVFRPANSRREGR